MRWLSKMPQHGLGSVMSENVGRQQPNDQAFAKPPLFLGSLCSYHELRSSEMGKISEAVRGFSPSYFSSIRAFRIREPFRGHN